MLKRLATATAAGLVLILLIGADGPEDEARHLAVKLTTAGAAMFDARDVKGLVQTYNEDARIEVISRDKDNGGLKTDTKVGRVEIEALYQDLFKPDQTIHARNNVDYARYVGHDLLAIGGTFISDTEAETPLKLPFIQVRSKSGGEWRIVSLQVFFAP